jgi:hypothetical protein
MAFIRTCIILPVALFCTLFTNAQTVSYPAQSSQLLKATAQDAAMLLQKAVSGSQFSVSSYIALPRFCHYPQSNVPGTKRWHQLY